MFTPSGMLLFKEKEWRLFWETKLMAKDTMETAHSNKEKWWKNNAGKYKDESKDHEQSNPTQCNDQNEGINMRK